MTTLAVQDLACIMQTMHVCSSRNVFKLPEYTHVKHVYDYFAALHALGEPVAASAHAQAVADVCKLIEVISERGGFHLLEFEVIHSLYERLKQPAAESAATRAPSANP